MESTSLQESRRSAHRVSTILRQQSVDPSFGLGLKRLPDSDRLPSFLTASRRMTLLRSLVGRWMGDPLCYSLAPSQCSCSMVSNWNRRDLTFYQQTCHLSLRVIAMCSTGRRAVGECWSNFPRIVLNEEPVASSLGVSQRSDIETSKPRNLNKGSCDRIWSVTHSVLTSICVLLTDRRHTFRRAQFVQAGRDFSSDMIDCPGSTPVLHV